MSYAHRAAVTAASISAAALASMPWNEIARAAIEWLACNRRQFTSDAFWALLDREGIGRPAEPRAAGGPFVYATNRGWIRKSGEVRQSQRPTTSKGTTHHTIPVPVYDSLIYGETPRLGWGSWH